MPDLSSLIERADRAASRLPLPPDGLERLHARRARKHRNQRIAAGVVGIGVFVGAIVLVMAGGSGQLGFTPGGMRSTVAPDKPAPTRPNVGRIGLVGLPSEGVTPSSPTRGTLVLSFNFGHTMGDPGRFNLNVYVDGRLIWQRLGDTRKNEPSTGLVEQRLTPEGVELVRAHVVSTRLFDHDLHLLGGHGLLFGNVRVRNGARLVTIDWGDVGPSNTMRTSPSPEQASALEHLDAKLEDLAWLPTSAWADREMKAFVPSRYWVCYETEEKVGLDGVFASLPGPVADFLRPLDRAAEQIEHFGLHKTTLYIWCSAVSTKDARTLAQIVDDSGRAKSSNRSVFGLEYTFGGPGSSEPDVRLSFDPMLPQVP